MWGDRYENSVCDESLGFLHDYKFVTQKDGDVVERCMNSFCGDVQVFRHNIPNAVYLSYHIRSALQPQDVLFKINYPLFDYSLLHR